jgi:hypothetical protein
MISGNVNFLEPSGPLRAGNGTALPLPYLHWNKIFHDPTHNIYVVSFGWPREFFSSLTFEWSVWPHRNAEKELMDREKKEHTSIKQHMTVSYEIWQTRNVSSDYLRSYSCFHEEMNINQEEHDIICHAILPAQVLD